MADSLQDVLAQASEDDIKAIQEELGKQEGKPAADSSPAKQTVEDASPEESSVTGTKSSVSEVKPEKETSKAKPQENASEGEKTPSTEITVKTRKRRLSKYVPYERFKEVNDKLHELEAKLSQIHSATPPQPANELEGLEQPYVEPAPQEHVSKVVAKQVKELIEPVIKTLDEKLENAELEKALQSHPEAEKYKDEIKAYAEATNLTYDDIVTLVLAKHASPVSKEQVQKAEAEAREAELSGKSNSTTSRARNEVIDPKKLSDEELENLINQI